MGVFEIEGGTSLKGQVQPQGAKNEALQVISAVLLTQESVVLENIPQIIDTQKLILILKNLGVEVNQLNENSYRFKATEINLDYIESEEYEKDCGQLRGSVLIVGPLLARMKKARLPNIGGDKIGRRRLDTHFNGFQKLGASFQYCADSRSYEVDCDDPKGTEILLEEASITGTANILMVAVLSRGITTMYNAACEPYIQQLCKMLNLMGAQISGIGSNLLRIRGVSQLGGVHHKILPDFIEIGSWIGLAGMTKSELTIKNVSWSNLGIIPLVFEKLGLNLIKENDDIYIPSHDQGYKIRSYIDKSILTISDAPWPGFTPDLLSIFLVVATQAKGSVLIHQKMFESRLFFVDKLIDMGAKIILCDPHRATVVGLNFENPLRATTMTSPDIRAGIALLIAALSADGISTIHNVEQIDRGYQNIDSRLRALGAKIERYP